jgi:hypothetical protein
MGDLRGQEQNFGQSGSAGLSPFHRELFEQFTNNADKKDAPGEMPDIGQQSVAAQLLRQYFELTGNCAAANDQPAKAKEPAGKEKPESYEAKEEERVRRYLEEWSRLSDMARAALAWSKLPNSVDLKSSQNGRSIELASDKFSGFFEAIPGLRLDKTVRDLLEGIRSISLKDNQLKLEGEITTKTQEGLPLILNNVTVDVIADPTDKDKIQLRNIKGMSCAGLAIKEADLTFKRDNPDGIVRLQVEVTNPVPKFLRELGAPQEDKIKLPEIPLSKAEAVNPIIDELRKKAGERDYVRMAEALTANDLPKELHDLIGSITGRSKRGDDLIITRTKATTHDLGGLTATLAERIEAKVTINEKEARLENIKGIDFKVPLPAEVKKLLKMDGLDSKLKELSLAAVDSAGNRILNIKFDSGSLVESMSIKVGKDMAPVLDKTGRMTVDIVAAKTFETDGKKETLRLPISVSFDPKQVANPGKFGPDFRIKLDGKDQDYLKVAESMVQGANLNEVKDLFTGVKSISKRGDAIVIERAEKTSRELGGLALDADQTIAVRIKQDKNTLKIADIQGITLTLKPEMPPAVKKYLGLDIGNIPVGIKNISIIDEGGNKQRVIVEGNNLLSKVGVTLKDGAPMLESDGRWKLYALVQCPPTIEERRLGKQLREMGVILPLDKDNKVALKSEETAALIAQVAFQNIDPDNPRTWGLGLIAIGSQTTSTAIETGKDLKARFDDGWRQVNDGTAVERFKDGASQLPGRFSSGLRRIGGWVGLD